MKKEECCSVFMTTLMIAIPVSAVIILMVYAFGFLAIPKGTSTYTFIKDHGSLIAGLIGFVGVLILVVTQIITTRKLMSNSREMVLLEAKEADKNEFYRNMNSIHKAIGKIGNIHNLYNAATATSQINEFDSVINNIDDVLLFLKKNKLKHSYFDFIREFLITYKETIYEQISYDDKYSDIIQTALNVRFDNCMSLLDSCLDEYQKINGNSLNKLTVEALQEARKLSFNQIDESFFKSILLLISIHQNSFVDPDVSLN